MRIASLAPSVTTILQELGMAEAIVACTHVCPLPPERRHHLAVGSFSALDEERLEAAKPDLVFTATLVQAAGQQRLREAGFSVVHLDPRRLLEVGEQYVTVAQHVGVPDRGEYLRDQFWREVLAFQNVCKTPRPRVYMEEWAQPPFVAGNWVPDMVRLAGGEPVLSRAGSPSREIVAAELQTADPDVIVQHVCLSPGYDWRALRLQHVDALRRRPGWADVRAVREGRVYAADDSLFNMPTRQLARGITWLQSRLSALM